MGPKFLARGGGWRQMGPKFLAGGGGWRALLGEEALLGGAKKSVKGALLEKLDLRPRRVQGCKGRSSLLGWEKHLAAQQWGN